MVNWFLSSCLNCVAVDFAVGLDSFEKREPKHSVPPVPCAGQIHDLRDIIRTLETHLDELGAAAEHGGVERLREELRKQTANSRRLQAQVYARTQAQNVAITVTAGVQDFDWAEVRKNVKTFFISDSVI